MHAITSHVLPWSFVLLALLCSSAAPRAQDAVEPARQSSQVFFFALKGEPKREPMDAALAEMGAKLVFGPARPKSSPDVGVVAVKAPAVVTAKNVEKALKKGKVRVESLTWAAYVGRKNNGALPSFAEGIGEKELILGMSGGLRWFDEDGEHTQFYYVPKKIEGEEILEKYGKLYSGVGGGTLGQVAHESIHWKLAAEVDKRQAKKLEKSIKKLPGIEEVSFSGTTLRVRAALADLPSSGPVRPFGRASARSVADPVGGSYPTNALYDLLLQEGLLSAEDAGDEG